MDIKGLQYFIAAAERLNFTTAAKECYITQTAMSLHISKMEDELGFKLFNRNR
ncbi:MAG: LysR family transcriptional regulator, partial [Clostridiales Family XIII bacterium]|nr:LysR family transcriptional regulator [Clostridiales Family XIII bacterium]